MPEGTGLSTAPDRQRQRDPSDRRHLLSATGYLGGILVIAGSLMPWVTGAKAFPAPGEDIVFPLRVAAAALGAMAILGVRVRDFPIPAMMGGLTLGFLLFASQGFGMICTMPCAVGPSGPTIGWWTALVGAVVVIGVGILGIRGSSPRHRDP